MKVRRATTEDLPALGAMWRRFFATCNFADLCDYSDEAAGNFLDVVIDADDKAVMVAFGDNGKVAGMAAAALLPLYFQPEYLMCSEIFWWVEPEHRGNGAGSALMNAIEEWAKRMGCNAIMMVAQRGGGTPEVAEAAYVKRGYRPLELAYIKELE